MSTVNSILEPNADGTVHLPLPKELRGAKVHVSATLSSVSDKAPSARRHRVPRATPEIIAKRKALLESLRAAGGLCDVIPDPAAWEREIRQDRPLPGRE